MPPLQFFRVFINERLIAVAAEIFGAVEKTVTEYQEESDHLRRLLRITPELKLCRIDSLQLSVSEEEVPPEQQHCEQEWSPSLEQEDPEPTQIKEEQEELRSSQEEEQLQEVDNDILEFKFNPPCVKNECDQENPRWSSTPPQTQTEENRESDSKPVDLKPLDTVTHLKDLNLPCHPQDNQNNQRTEVKRDPGRFDPNKPPDPSPFSHTRSSNKISSTCNPNAHVRHCQLEKPCSICRKTFTYKGNVSEQSFMRKTDLKRTLTHTGKKPFRCGDCGKSFSRKQTLTHHKLTHTGEKPFKCGDCEKSFSEKGMLNRHILIHTGVKPFICGDCGKNFSQKGHLKQHILTHTGEKPFICGNCGKSFSQKQSLILHKLAHTRKKPFSCGECGKSFKLMGYLRRHLPTHTREKLFSSGDCGERFERNENLDFQKRSHTQVRLFSCRDCGKVFIRKENLIKHKLTHMSKAN